MSLSGIVVAFCLANLTLSATVCCGHTQTSSQYVWDPNTNLWMQLFFKPTKSKELHYQMIRIKSDVVQPKSVPLVCENIVATTPYGKQCYDLRAVDRATKYQKLDISQILPTAECYVAHAAGIDRCRESAGQVIKPKMWTNIRPVHILHCN